MTREEYQQYLRSPQWREKRDAVLKRAGGKCEECTREYKIRGKWNGYMVWPVQEVHHLTYERVGNENLDDLIGLCKRHHHAEHFVDPKREREFAEMKRRMAEIPEWEPDMSEADPTAPSFAAAQKLGVSAREIPAPPGHGSSADDDTEIP